MKCPLIGPPTKRQAPAADCALGLPLGGARPGPQGNDKASRLHSAATRTHNANCAEFLRRGDQGRHEAPTAKFIQVQTTCSTYYPSHAGKATTAHGTRQSVLKSTDTKGGDGSLLDAPVVDPTTTCFGRGFDVGSISMHLHRN